MSVTNPVISDLIVTTYERDRYSEVEKLRVRRNPERGAPRTLWRGITRMARGVTGATVFPQAGRRFRPRVAVPAGSGDGRLC